MKKNNKVHLYIILLCCGVVISVASLINILNPSAKYVEYTEEEIKSKAKELGMIELKELIKIGDDLDTEKTEKQELKEEMKEEEDKENSDIDNNVEKSNTNEKNIEENANEVEKEKSEEKSYETVVFKINRGEKSENIILRLYNLGLIDDEDEFIDLVRKKRVARYFSYGSFELSKDMDPETILKVLTRR